ncbi:MAG TPA: hypothetical protein VIV60_20320 [Polyangiaceae bacterium]
MADFQAAFSVGDWVKYLDTHDNKYVIGEIVSVTFSRGSLSYMTTRGYWDGTGVVETRRTGVGGTATPASQSEPRPKAGVFQ